MKFLAFLSVVFFMLPAKGQDTQNIYSGGMLIYQPGLLKADNNHKNIQTSSTGLGGMFRLYFLKNFTCGITGGSTKAYYKTLSSEISYVSVGYGGPFVGLSKRMNKIRLTASFMAAYGVFRNLHIEEQNAHVLNQAYFYKEKHIVYAPILSADYHLSERFVFTVQGIHVFSQFRGKDFSNTALQLGLLFNR